MRLLHPRTIQICADHGYKTVIAHAWAEVFKWLGSGQKHPKMFLTSKDDIGHYLALVYYFGLTFPELPAKKCKLNEENVKKLGKTISKSFDKWFHSCVKYGDALINTSIDGFDKSYLFSDACSLYFKGINIFEDLFPGESEKYIPVISHKEIIRQCTKTLNKKV